MAVIRDIVEVRTRPTVVRLEESAGADWVAASYHLTPDVRAHVSALEHALARDSGTGAFLIAPYGAGKSHFLAWLGDRIEHGAFVTPPPSVVRLSLLNYRAALGLEAILGGVLGVPSSSPDRRDDWRAILAAHPHGLVLLIDELSEFLRSKPDARRFAEDQRFLQFLGELASSTRLFIIAALQEAIEHTGAIDRQSFRKIKDRFPLRMRLTPAHVRDLLATHLLVKKDGYDERVRAITTALERALPGADVRWDELASIYPIHPATLRMLEDVRDRFSQTRGAVELCLHRLAGDPARGIEPFLDRPLGELLTPEVIVEHFEDVLELQPEFLPIAQQLFPFYRREMSRLFPQPRSAELAWRVLRLLVLDHLRTGSEGLTAAEVAGYLLFAPSRLEPEKNQAIVGRVLDRLSTEARYVRSIDDRYRLDLQHDAGTRLEKLLARELAELPDDEACFAILESADLPRRFDPFSAPRERWQLRQVRWCFHERVYALWTGDADPQKPPEAAALSVRLPWGHRDAVPGVSTLVPAPLELDPPLRELAALLRLTGGATAADVRQLAEARIAERAELFDRRVREAYAKAQRISPVGRAVPAPPPSPDASFDGWLDAHALEVLRERFPRFESFAPDDGPLPKEAYRAFVRFASARGLTSPDVDPWMTRVRDGYLVKMGLVRRKGGLYELPKRLDQHELVRLVLPLAAHETPIERVYADLGGPIYGLVPDQLHLLLLFLVIVGEIDVVKEGRSIRALSDTFPLPSAYERVVPGRALGAGERRFLERLSEGLGVAPPHDASVLAEQRAVQLVRAALREPRSALDSVRHAVEGEAPLTAKIDELERWCALLDPPAEELEAITRLAAEVGAASRMLERVRELAELPQRIEHAKRERAPFVHLARQPGFPELGEPPPLADTSALEAWLVRADSLHREHAARYREAHERFWREHPAIHTEPLPRVVDSAHVGLGAEKARWTALSDDLHRARCRGLTDLTFQTRCACGFDGESAPHAELAREQAALRERIERELARVFAGAEVRERVRAWARTGLEASDGTRAYLDGASRWPDVTDLAAFDRHLAGVELVARLDGLAILRELEGSWDPEELVRAFAARVQRGGAGRVRIEMPHDAAQEEVARFCVEQALRHAVPLPAGVRAGAAVVAQVDPSWVGERALARLDELGLDDALVDRVLGMVANARVDVPIDACAMVRAARDLIDSAPIRDAAHLAELAERAYLHAPRLERASKERLRDHLARIACAEVSAEALMDVLERHADHDWLVLDAFGLPMVRAVSAELGAQLPRYRLSETRFAVTSARTMTDTFYRDLAARGVAHAFEKVDAIDQMLHAHTGAFEDLQRLAMASLAVGLRRLRDRYDGQRPLLVTGDHGFVLAADGRRWVHGGRSTLERVVPVLTLARRTR